jgi:hypothetical protein
VKNIVIFIKPLDPVIEELPMVNFSYDGMIQQDMSDRSRVQLIQALPKTFQSILKHHFKWFLSGEGKLKADPDEFEFYSLLVNSPGLRICVSKSVREIVASPAIAQTFKGFLSAGIFGSLKYVTSKFLKRLNAKM